MSGVDIIGDVHGHASKLEHRLQDLGYTIDADTGAYRHAERSAVFVGDLIDRGPEQLRVLQIVKAMVDSGSARMVLGNHEFNAIAYATEHPDRPGEYLRPHNDKNTRQHAAFLEQLTAEQQRYYLDWFGTLPLWLDLGGVRVVHACWHEPSMAVVRAVCGSDRLSGVEHLVAASTKGDELYDAVEILLKGPEISLVDYGQPAYVDKDGHRRTKARVRWWHQGASTLADLAEVGAFRTADGNPYPRLPEIEVDERDRSFVYNDAIPLFYGHYWRQEPPVHLDDWTEYTACVDFSAGKGGTLVAYRWDGQATIAMQNYVPHGADVVAQAPAEG
ncbi:MAG: metallophosphatase [Mycobacterium sp.]|nr:MAG: metallophosphatase [Mycobacterium sp.]HQE15677.1 metallophosphoesterase [Mycobacterium sp.]